MDKKIREAFEVLSPDEEQSSRMLREIELKSSHKRAISHKLSKKLRVAVTAMMMVVLTISIGTVTNVATDGKVMEVIKDILGIKQHPQDVAGQAVNIAERGIEIWAPEIYGMDDDHIIFGTKRGLIVYDRAKDGVSATVDTQEIGCIYFESNEKSSHVLMNDGNIILYNSENNRPYGKYYIYNVKDEGELVPAEEGEDKGVLEKYHAQWLEHQHNYHDTFDMYSESQWYKELSEKMGDMYSRRSMLYDGEYNFLVIKDGQYLLYTDKKGELEGNIISMNLLFETESEEPEVLPMYEYTGSDKAMAAICDWFYEEAVMYAEKGEVWVPGFIIRHEDDKNGEHLVFGNFWSYGYKKNGIMMEVSSGGEMPACFHLKEREDGSYEVVSVDRARDGNLYAEDIKDFCKGYPGLASKLINNDTDKRRDAARDHMSSYVENSGLDVKYIKEYGWDPYEIN